MSRIPWISGFVFAVAAAVPPGRDLIEAALFSNEALTRNIARPIVVIAFGILAILVVIEWYVKGLFEKKPPPIGAPTASANTKPTE